MDTAEKNLKKEHGFLNRDVLKYFAVLCMLGDHIGFAFVKDGVPATILEFFGGLTMPVMAFFLAEGYRYTRDVKKYALRLFIFALIAVVPFTFLLSGKWLPVQIADGQVMSSFTHFYLSNADKTVVICRANFLFTLLLSLLNIAAWDKLKVPVPVKVIITFAVCWLSTGCDWGYWCVLMSFVFWKFREKDALKWALYSLISLSCVLYFKVFGNPLLFDITYSFKPVHFNLFLVIPLMAFCYNGKKGKGGKFGKWFFYIFYPAHILVIDVILVLLNNR